MVSGNPNIAQYATNNFENNPERASAAGKKGGSVCSYKKKMAAYMRHMSGTGSIKEEDIPRTMLRAIAQLKDPDVADLDILEYLNRIREKVDEINDPMEQLKVIKAMTDVYKVVFGEKKKNLNLNVNADGEMAKQIIAELLG